MDIFLPIKKERGVDNAQRKDVMSDKPAILQITLINLMG